MNVLVCIKRVPDTATAIKPSADGKSIERGGVEHIISPFDEYAIQAGLDLKKDQPGEVVVLTLGNSDAQKELRSALALGCDRAVLLKTDQTWIEPLAVAKAVASWAKDKKFDAVLCGQKATDDDNYQFGPMLATLLNIPHVAVVTELKVEGTSVTAKREVEGGHEVVKTTLPCLITCQKGLNTPGYASLKGIMAAKKKPLEEVPAALESAGVEVLSVKLPAPRAAGRIVGEGVEAIPALLDALKNEAKVI